MERNEYLHWIVEWESEGETIRGWVESTKGSLVPGYPGERRLVVREFKDEPVHIHHSKVRLISRG